MSDPLATVRMVDGQYVLDDPVGIEVIRAVGKHNCRATWTENHERIEHFANRILEKGLTSADVVIVILNVDDPHGGPLADGLMPGHEAMWQDFRDKGMVPFARGLAGREGIQNVLALFDEEASEKLARIDGIAVVVVDHEVAEVWPWEG